MLTFIFTFLLVFIANQVNTGSINETETWNGNWFPSNPFKESSKKTKINTGPKNETETWNGNWFPSNPYKEPSKKSDLQELFDTKKTETNIKESWKGNWFPHTPNATITNNKPSKKTDLQELFDTTKTTKTETNTKESLQGNWFPHIPKAVIPNNVQSDIFVQPDCDDGKTNIDIDFDPENKRHNYKYLCLDRKEKYDPSFATSPIQREFIVPPAFKAPSYCQNETIEYDERLPTFGAHRYLYPKYGEYKFLPIQRWMYNLEYGVVVMLYHPCANQMQVEKLRGILNACLYRHIITPSTSLLAERPLALVVWGKSFEMSVVDVSTVVNFIKSSAKKGPQAGEPDIGWYDIALIAEAKLVTDKTDSEICANINL